MSLTAYVLRAVTVLIVMSACAYILVRYSRKNNLNLNGTQDVKLLTSLRLTARDIFFVVKCGPEVIAFTTGNGGTCLLGRWSYEDWSKSQHED